MRGHKINKDLFANLGSLFDHFMNFLNLRLGKKQGIFGYHSNILNNLKMAKFIFIPITYNPIFYLLTIINRNYWGLLEFPYQRDYSRRNVHICKFQIFFNILTSIIAINIGNVVYFSFTFRWYFEFFEGLLFGDVYNINWDW